MKILLDTHTFLWFVLGDSQLSAAARAEIESSATHKLISPATYWEIAIKISVGKYTVPIPFADFIEKSIDDNGMEILPIEPRHAAALMALPFHHRDPFDRLLIAQAIVEQISLVSADKVFDQYPVTRIW